MSMALPDYMVPSAFVRLESLPLSTNGKLDRKALPLPEQSAFASRAFEAPIGEIEQKIAALWAELLKVDRVGRHDNFFELGGHSLLAVTLMQRIEQQGLPGDVRALFTNPTVAGLAASTAVATLDSVPPNGILSGSELITPEMLPLVKLTQGQIDKLVASLPGGVRNIQDIYPLAPLQEGIFFQHLMTPSGDPYLTPLLMAFDQRARLDSFLQALDAVITRHDVLRTGIASKGFDQPIQYVLRQAPSGVAGALRSSIVPVRSQSGAITACCSRARCQT
jgi:aryl carrier-like protein